jgi:hypothetical protein
MASESGQHRVANRNHDLIIGIAEELRNRGRAGEQILRELLKDNDLAVRVWAARHCLPFAATFAEQVLQEAAIGPPSLCQLSAAMTLKEWKAGRL